MAFLFGDIHFKCNLLCLNKYGPVMLKRTLFDDCVISNLIHTNDLTIYSCIECTNWCEMDDKYFYSTVMS